MEIRFQSPAMNLVGFEQKPRSFQQLQQLASAENILGQPQQLFIFSAGADCTLNTVDVHAPFEDEHEHSEEEHADFTSHYHYRCNDTTKLSGLKVTLFEHFPLIEQIRVQVLSEKGQLAFDLLRGSYIIDL